MYQTEQEKFSALFSDTLFRANIEYSEGNAGISYVVHNSSDVLFWIVYYKETNKYEYTPSDLLKSEYKKYSLQLDAKPNTKELFETVEFTYKTRKIKKQATKEISQIYINTLIESDIVFEMRKNFETYFVLNAGIPSFAIGYNPETKKYGIKLYDLIQTLYKACNIPLENKPDLPSLYRKAKDFYMAQVVCDNAYDLQI